MLTEVQLDLIRYVCAHFRETGSWPRAWKVDLDLESILDAEGGLKVVCESLGNNRILCGSVAESQSEVKVRIRGLSLVPEGAEDVDAFLELCRYAARVFRSSDEPGVAITLQDFANTTGRSEESTKRVFELALLDGHFWQSGSSAALQLNPFAAKLQEVESLDDYDTRWNRYQERAGTTSWSASQKAKRPISRVFLSHAAADARLAAYIASVIETAVGGVTVFVASAPGKITTGSAWHEAIRTELRSADTYLVLITPRSIDRPWIFFETGAAWMSDRRLLPVLAPGVRHDVVPMPLAALQMLSLDREEDVRQLFQDIGLALTDVTPFIRAVKALSEREAEMRR